MLVPISIYSGENAEQRLGKHNHMGTTEVPTTSVGYKGVCGYFCSFQIKFHFSVFYFGL